MYRKQDLKYLQDIFDRPSNDIAVLYGKSTSGLSEILRDFSKDKEFLYYRATAVQDQIQRQLFAGEIHEQTRSPIFPEDDYDRLITTYINENGDSKKLIIFGDFYWLIKANPTFINFLSQLLFHQTKAGSVMILLVCDDIRWVENDMIRLIGRKSSEISGVIKMHAYSATEFVECFPRIPLSEAMAIYSVIGGKCRYYSEITDESTAHSVVISELERFADDSFEPGDFLPKDIREPAVYNTILLNIAAGHAKLNELHNATGIDRAKLSVYLKTLIESGIVKKAVSADVGDGANVLKGTYLIVEREEYFYYKLVYPHLSSLRVIGAERFYRRFIDQEIIPFIEEFYPHFCMEHVAWLRDHDRLNFRVSSIEEYYDKAKAIGFVVVAAGGSVIACATRYAGPHMSYQTYEDVKAAVRRNKINCDNIWLFSASGFDQKLAMFGSVTPGVRLIDGAEQRLR